MGSATPAEVGRIALEAGVAVHGMVAEHADLERAFLRLTAGQYVGAPVPRVTGRRRATDHHPGTGHRRVRTTAGSRTATRVLDHRRVTDRHPGTDHRRVTDRHPGTDPPGGPR